MEIYTNALTFIDHKPQVIRVFGYTSNGLPGLEIIGLGNYSRLIKEKIVFLLRSQSIKVPLGRYVIGVESSKALKPESSQFLELPILLLYLALSKNISVVGMNRCLCGGYVGSSGVIKELDYSQFISELSAQYTLLSSRAFGESEYQTISLRNILMDKVSFEFSSTALISH